jgi:hypothetical protein
MQRYRDRLPVVAAALLLAATVLFVAGTTLERSLAKTGRHQEAGTAERPAGEAAEHGEPAATEAPSNATTEGIDGHGGTGEPGEELLGVNPESAGLTAAAAAVSLLLAALLVARPRTGLLLAVVVAGLAFAGLDAREGIHQAGEPNAGLVVVALLTGLLHLAVAVAAAAGLRTQRAAALTG